MASPAPKIELHRLTIRGTTLVSKKLEIQDGDLVEFHVEDFKGKKYCEVTISAINYTDDGVTGPTLTTVSAADTPVPQPLGTIKIGS